MNERFKNTALFTVLQATLHKKHQPRGYLLLPDEVLNVPETEEIASRHARQACNNNGSRVGPPHVIPFALATRLAATSSVTVRVAVRSGVPLIAMGMLRACTHQPNSPTAMAHDLAIPSRQLSHSPFT